MEGTELRGGRGISAAVVEAVAAAEGVDPVALTEPLYAAVNPDALDALFRAASGQVTFEYHGNRVTVDEDGAVDVVPL